MMRRPDCCTVCLHASIVLIAIILAFPVSVLNEDSLSGALIGIYTSINGGPTSDHHPVFAVDEYGVPIVKYGYYRGQWIGDQRNPVTIALFGIDYYKDYKRGDKEKRDYFLNCARWIVNNSVPRDGGNFSVLEYHFPAVAYNISAPWVSGMAHGLAIELLTYAYNDTDNDTYLKTAKKLLRSFYYDVEDGGVTRKSPDQGWWYEEYAKEGCISSRVLNGMIFALFGLHTYYEYTNDTDALFLFNMGVLAVEANIHFYDDNGYSYYDILKNPSGPYHKIHIWQLEKLYNLTHRPIFKYYHDRWAAYRPPNIIGRIMTCQAKRVDYAVVATNTVVVFIMIEGSIKIRRKLKK